MVVNFLGFLFTSYFPDLEKKKKMAAWKHQWVQKKHIENLRDKNYTTVMKEINEDLNKYVGISFS